MSFNPEPAATVTCTFCNAVAVGSGLNEGNPHNLDVNLDRMNTLSLRGDHLTLAQAVKAAGLATTGGQAKHIIRDGKVLLNGAVEIRPGRKLTAGDRFNLVGESEWTVSR